MPPLHHSMVGFAALLAAIRRHVGVVARIRWPLARVLPPPPAPCAGTPERFMSKLGDSLLYCPHLLPLLGGRKK
eukprot:175724-Chlamydomonas_euryale.AAC.4